MMASTKSQLKVDGKIIAVSNLDKILFPKTRFAKGDVLDYYIKISPVLLPHLQERPLTLKRYPEGVLGNFFYEKRCPPYRPSWLTTAPIWSERKQERIYYCTVNDLPSLVWLVNLDDLELHTSLAKRPNLSQSTMVVFDLDPGIPADILDCCKVALLLQSALADLNLECFVKTSGSKGLQVYVPLNTQTSYDQTKPFAKALAVSLEKSHPDRIVSKMTKSLRKGKVLIDWSQNDEHKTTVCVYSIRAQERPTVSTPVQWKEIEAALRSRDSQKLYFETTDTLKRVKKWGDLFAPVLTLKQKLPKLPKKFFVHA